MKLTIKLDCRKSGETKKGFPIVVAATHQYKQKAWRTGYYAKKNQWASGSASPTSKHPNYYALSDYLTWLKSKLSKVEVDYHKKPMPLSAIHETIFNNDSDVFYEAALASFPEGYKGTVLGAVKSFNSFAPNLCFSEVDQKTVNDYVQHLMKKGNKPGGVDSYLRSLRTKWGKLTDRPNPFKGIKVEIPITTKRTATDEDLKKLHAFLKDHTLHYNEEQRKKIKQDTYIVEASKGNGGYINYAKYWLLMFYLGGIDPEVLSKLRYDQNVVNGRITFNRNKGGSKTHCSNIIPPEAKKLLKTFKCKPYLVPIHESKNYKTFSDNFSSRMQTLSEGLQLSVRLRPKSARYTFIDRAQQLLIDERITAQIVGHKRRTTTSIYTNDFPLSVQDKAHLSIISGVSSQ